MLSLPAGVTSAPGASATGRPVLAEKLLQRVPTRLHAYSSVIHTGRQGAVDREFHREIIYKIRSQNDANTMPNLCQKYAQMMQTRCQHDAKTMPKWRKHYANMTPTRCRNYANTMPKRRQNDVKTVPQLSNNYQKSIPKHIQQTTYVRNVNNIQIS